MRLVFKSGQLTKLGKLEIRNSKFGDEAIDLAFHARIAYHLLAMKTSNAHDQRIATMSFASVYPMYLAKVKKKGRTRDELHQVIQWLTGFDDGKLQELIEGKATFETFFAKARLNPHARFIHGMICGYRVEDIENPLTRQVRYLDKLVDELAQGRKMERILRSA